MGRKNSFIIWTMTAACVFGACGRSDGDGMVDIGKEEQMEAADLTEQTAQHVTIDYNIESYESIQKFGHDLLMQSIQDQNPVLSPVSAYLALSMAGCGADGATREEFYNVLGKDMMTLYDDMMNTLPAEGDLLKLVIADSVWIDDRFIVDDTWIGTVGSLMDAEIYQEKLSTEETMKKINHWIDDRTSGLIDQMLEQPLNEAVRLALINTVYFKGKWEIPFDANDTRREEFYLNGDRDTAVQVDMMNLYLTDLDYVANDFAEGIVLPYRKNDDGKGSEDLAFVALKPTENGDVREVYRELTMEVMDDILVNKKTETVNLKLPKFELTFDKVLNDSLSDMGLTECFDMEKANFDQMGKTLDGDNLFIGLVRQKAKIIVDEEGTEAAAATEVLMACGAAMEPQEYREVYFDEPFVYMIMDMERGIPLFMGILDDPGLQ